MRPAFENPRQAALFVAVCLLALGSPWLLPAHWLDQRETSYSNAPLRLGPYPWLQKKIFHETGPADLVLAGSSHIWAGISAVEAKKMVENRVGRPADVFTLGWPWPGYDALYFITRDLLMKRSVRCLVIYNEGSGGNDFHLAASQWLRFSRDRSVLQGLSGRLVWQAYAASILGVPRLVLSSLRSDGPTDTDLKGEYWQSFYQAPPVASQNGTLTSHLGFDYDPTFPPAPPFPEPPAQGKVYGSATKGLFFFQDAPLSELQDHFLVKVIELAQAYGTRVVLANFPVLKDAKNAEVVEPQCWPERFDGRVKLAGVSPQRLFQGIPEDQLRNLYYDARHFNAHGQELYTRSILSAIEEVYAK